MTLLSRQAVTEQVWASLGAFGEEYDVEGIVAAIERVYGLVDIDVVAADEYWAIVEQYELS